VLEMLERMVSYSGEDMRRNFVYTAGGLAKRLLPQTKGILNL
jgi:hypothetical protein